VCCDTPPTAYPESPPLLTISITRPAFDRLHRLIFRVHKVLPKVCDFPADPKHGSQVGESPNPFSDRAQHFQCPMSSEGDLPKHISGRWAGWWVSRKTGSTLA
jgi:hypothetical protein